jgi:hypothetical protein
VNSDKVVRSEIRLAANPWIPEAGGSIPKQDSIASTAVDCGTSPAGTSTKIRESKTGDKQLELVTGVHSNKNVGAFR